MSGGHFNYLCYKDEAHDILKALPDIREMEEYLRMLRKHDIADEILKFQLELETQKRRIEVMAKRLEPIFHAVEWEASSDWNIEQVDAAWVEFNTETDK